MSKKINIAIVGLGFGAEFIPIYQRHPNASMYAICQRNKEKLDQIGDAFGIQARYTSFDELIEDPNIDAVHINSPIHEHARMSAAALKQVNTWPARCQWLHRWMSVGRSSRHRRLPVKST